MNYLTEKPAATAEQLAQIAKLEAEAKAARERSEESFRRCDTDGFLSQWANDMTSSLNLKQVEVLRNGGHALFPVLCDAQGNVIADRIYRFPAFERPWETVRKWKLPDALAAECGRKWIPFGLKSKVQKKLGLHEEDRWFPAKAKLSTRGRKSTGLSGCANAYVAVVRLDSEDQEGF